MLKKHTSILFGCIILFCVGSLLGFLVITGANESDDIASDTGKIVYLDFEGGFYGIEADDGSKYDPINLPPKFMAKGLRIKFKAKILRDRESIHMWGEIVELLYINYDDNSFLN